MATSHHQDGFRKIQIPEPCILGRSGVGPGNMYFQSSGPSFIPVSEPGTLGGIENIIVREKNQFLPYGPFK